MIKEVPSNPATFAAPPLALLVLAGVAPVDFLLADLASHFMAQYAIGAAVLLAAGVFFKSSKPVLELLAALFCIALYQLSPFLPLGAEAAAGGKTLKVLDANVFFINKDPLPLKRLIGEEKPDLVVTQETPPVFAKMFATLKKEYPYQDIHPEATGPRGLAVLSKTPFEKIAITSFDNPGIPAQQFTIRHAGKSITFLSLHPFTPTENIARRDNEFRLVTERFSKKQPENLVLLGDFNATPYCQAYKKLVSALGLKNAREGRGIIPTWPAFLPTPWLRIPIDHALVSKNIAVSDYRTGPPIGSDHLPTITEIALRAAP